MQFRDQTRKLQEEAQNHVSGTVIDASDGMKTDKGFVYVSSVLQKEIVRI